MSLAVQVTGTGMFSSSRCMNTRELVRGSLSMVRRGAKRSSASSNSNTVPKSAIDIFGGAAG